MDQRIASLTDRQALDILSEIALEFAADDMPDSDAERAEALQAALSDRGISLLASRLSDKSAASAASAARVLLEELLADPEVAPVLAGLLQSPPGQDVASIPASVTDMVVLTGCLVTLQIVGHVHISRADTGKWTFDYDPARKAPLDDLIKRIADILAKFGGTGGS